MTTVKGNENVTGKTLTIRSNIRDYPVIFVNDFEAGLNSSLKDFTFLIVDKNIANLYGPKLSFALSRCRYLIVEATEENKDIRMIEEFISSLLKLDIKKGCNIIAIGGGIIQDISGFVASILFRGIEWELYPTTLLAQADSCIGSKTSVNIKGYKNQLGTFYPPKRVVIDLEFLKTLEIDAVKCGLGEIIKVFLLRGKEDFYYLKSIYTASLYKDWDVLLELIHKALDIKKGFIEKDEFDRGCRNLMNYGHTFGHAVESATNYAVPHGQAVTIGMDFSNYMSMRLGYLTDRDYNFIRELLVKNFPEIDLNSIREKSLLSALSKDKKNIGKKCQFILTRGIGCMFRQDIAIEEFAGFFKDYVS